MEIRIPELMAAPVRVSIRGAQLIMNELFDPEKAARNADTSLEGPRRVKRIDGIIHPVVDLRETNIDQPGVIFMPDTTAYRDAVDQQTEITPDQPQHH